MAAVLDSGAVSFLASHSPMARAFLRELPTLHGWPLTIPSVVLVECLTGRGTRDAAVNRFLKSCMVRTDVPPSLARRAAALRHRARMGSAVDAIVVAMARPGDLVITADYDDLFALAEHADDVHVLRV